MATEEKLTFFYNGPFSQWHPAQFIVDEVMYTCAEQYMMAEKARLFGDEANLRRIMATNNPRKQKMLGREVAGFDAQKWAENAKLIVYRGSLAKFTQNEELFAVLMKTDGTTLVEASPVDRVWGIGLGEKDPRALDPKQWNGENWLGEILAKVREDLKIPTATHDIHTNTPTS